MKVVEVRLGEQTVIVTVEAEHVRIADQQFGIARIGRGLYRVSADGRHWAVAVTGPPENRWLFVDGQVGRVEAGPPSPARPGGSRRERHRSEDLAAPMPATVVRVLVEPGATVARGDTLIVLEAMKMELPIRAPRDGVVKSVHCAVGDLVQPGATLLDLE